MRLLHVQLKSGYAISVMAVFPVGKCVLSGLSRVDADLSVGGSARSRMSPLKKFPTAHEFCKEHAIGFNPQVEGST